MTLAVQDFSSKRADILQQVICDKHTHFLLGAVLKPYTAELDPLSQQHQYPKEVSNHIHAAGTFLQEISAFRGGIR